MVIYDGLERKKWLNVGLFLVVVISWGMAFFEY
jgi:uncharacterized protein (DUF486 family)